MTLDGIAVSDWHSQRECFMFKGHAIGYWAAGPVDGDVLLLIHGFPTCSWDWHCLWKPLAQRYRVIACDMLGFGYSAKPLNHDYRLLEQADIQQALLAHLGFHGGVHVLAHDYGDSVAQELLARHYEERIRLASCVFLNGGLFPETHRPLLTQKLLLSPLGFLVGMLFSRPKLKASLTKVFSEHSPPSEEELDNFWHFITHNDGARVMHKLIRYMPERREHRDRWVAAMQRGDVPLRVIDGAADPISGAHMVARYCELLAAADTVLLEKVGHYPQLEAPQEVLQHYLAFRQRLSAD